jgi:hypothetical protein
MTLEILCQLDGILLQSTVSPIMLGNRADAGDGDDESSIRHASDKRGAA